jgi:hypothetical protein
MMNATITIQCPPMLVVRVRNCLNRTAAEPMTATVKFDDGTELTIPDVIIPPTDVHEHSLLDWVVDPCVGANFANNSLRVELPAENCKFNFAKFAMIAEAMVGQITLTTLDKGTFKGTATFPAAAAPIALGKPIIVEAVTATGTLTLTQANERAEWTKARLRITRPGGLDPREFELDYGASLSLPFALPCGDYDCTITCQDSK